MPLLGEDPSLRRAAVALGCCGCRSATGIRQQRLLSQLSATCDHIWDDGKWVAAFCQPCVFGRQAFGDNRGWVVQPSGKPLQTGGFKGEESAASTEVSLLGVWKVYYHLSPVFKKKTAWIEGNILIRNKEFLQCHCRRLLFYGLLDFFLEAISSFHSTIKRQCGESQ